MTRFLHTMLRVTDPAKSGAFYETLGMEFRRKGDIVRDGHHEATLFFYAFPGEDVELELTWNTDGRTYDLGTAYGHIAIRVEDMDDALAQLATQGIEPEKAPYRVSAGGSLICFVQDPDG
jgi:lactoylglutathione lyase